MYNEYPVSRIIRRASVPLAALTLLVGCGDSKESTTTESATPTFVPQTQPPQPQIECRPIITSLEPGQSVSGPGGDGETVKITNRKRPLGEDQTTVEVSYNFSDETGEKLKRLFLHNQDETTIHYNNDTNLDVKATPSGTGGEVDIMGALCGPPEVLQIPKGPAS